MDNNLPLVISIEQLCHFLNIGKNVAYKLLTEGKISAFKIGRIWKIPRDSLLTFIHQHNQSLSSVD